MKQIVVAGGTGFIGSHLVAALVARGDEVTVLSREPARASVPAGARAAAWDAGAIGGADAVVNLAGEQAVGVRWTAEAKARIVASRVEPTRRLIDAMRDDPPEVFLSASAVGYYGDGTTPVDERSAAGGDFLAELTVEWEAASQADFHVRVVNPRIGVVIARDGGALVEMAKPFKLFAGGPIGSGRQVMSWVHIDDAVAILIRCIDDPTIRGPVNVVAPEAVTNAELARAIGRALHRPSWMRVPAAALRLRFGEGADPLLTGQRVVPRVLAERGFMWRYPTIDEALEQALC